MLLAAWILIPLVEINIPPLDPVLVPWIEPSGEECEVIRFADRVEAFQIPHGPGMILISNGVQVYQESRGGRTMQKQRDLTPDQAAAVTRILLDDLPATSPAWHIPVKPFIPTVGLTFFRGERSVDAFLDVTYKVCKVGSGSGALDPAAERLRTILESAGVPVKMNAP